MQLSQAAQLPVYRGQPVVGSLFEMARDELAFMERAAQLGDTVALKFLNQRAFLPTHPDQIKKVLVDGAAHYTKNSWGFKRLKPLLGNGLLTSTGAQWLRQRRLAQPAFHRKRIAGFADTMTEEAQDLVARFEGYADAGAPVDVGPEMMRITLLVACRTLFGTDSADDVETVHKAFGFLNEYLIARIRKPWLAPLFIPTPNNLRFKHERAQLFKIIERIIADRRASDQASHDLLSLLMEARDEDTGETMSDEQLRDEMVTLFLAGHETTALVLTWTLYLLSEHPNIADDLRAEVESLNGKPPRLADVPQLSLHKRVIQESMRLYPPAYAFGRLAEKDDQLDGHQVKKGDLVFIVPWLVHRRPDLWPQPKRFDPSRFEGDWEKQRPKLSYLPFGGGQRKCIGDGFAMLEAQLVLAALTQRFRFDVAPGHKVDVDPLLTLRPKGGMPMIIKRC